MFVGNGRYNSRSSHNSGVWDDAWTLLMENASANESLLSPFSTMSINSASSAFASSPFISSPFIAKKQAFFGSDFNLESLNEEESANKTSPNQCYSKKVFVGGIPAGTSQSILHSNFVKFGKTHIDWPKKSPGNDAPPEGYAFAVFEEESSIYKLLQVCTQNENRTIFLLQTSINHLHPVEIKIWELNKAVFVGTLGWRKYRRFSVFVGGLPRTCSSENLANLLEEVIGSVAYCSIELDRVTQYPKGAACVLFCTKESYIKSLAIHEIVLRFSEGDRKVELKSFLMSNMPCEKCGLMGNTKFCGEMICLAYFCDGCWKHLHSQRPGLNFHVPVVIKKSRVGSVVKKPL